VPTTRFDVVIPTAERASLRPLLERLAGALASGVPGAHREIQLDARAAPKRQKTT